MGFYNPPAAGAGLGANTFTGDQQATAFLLASQPSSYPTPSYGFGTSGLRFSGANGTMYFISNNLYQGNINTASWSVKSGGIVGFESAGDATAIDSAFSRGGAAGTVCLGTGAALNTSAQLFAGGFNYLGTTTGAADAMVATPTPAISALVVGATYSVKANASNATTTPTINISSLGAKTLVKRVNTALAAGDYLTNMHIDLRWDGANMVLLNPVVN